MREILDLLSVFVLPFLIVGFVAWGLYKKVPVYEEFVAGAKEGFDVAKSIIPYLVAILFAIGMFRASGAMDALTNGLRPILSAIGFLPVLLLGAAAITAVVLAEPQICADGVRWPVLREYQQHRICTLLDPARDPLGKGFHIIQGMIAIGSGSVGVLAEMVKTYGEDSILVKMAATMFGSSETTFYVIAVYFGAVGIRKTRHALPAGLVADLAAALLSVVVIRWMFG